MTLHGVTPDSTHGLSVQVVLLPAVTTAALLSDFARWAAAAAADASYSAAMTLTPEDEAEDDGPATFTVHQARC